MKEVRTIKIGLDLRYLNSMTGGIKRYTEKVFQELLKIDQESFFPFGESNENLDFSLSHNYWLKIPISNDEMTNKYTAFNYFVNDLDVLFSTYFPLTSHNNVNSVLTIHDLIPIIYPEYAIHQQTEKFFKEDIFEAANSAKVIIADSEATKKDIVNYFEISESKIKVVYLGCDNLSEVEPDKNLLKKYNIFEANYILSVCTLEPRKNLNGVIEAFEKVKREKADLKLVLVGALGWKYESLLEQIKGSMYYEDIVVTGFVNDEELVSLYKFAEVFAFPSFYEGFGLPVLEAMAYGTPVVTANNSSLPEVGGDACLYCNPYDTDDIKNKLLLVLNDEQLAMDMTNKGLKRAELFTWEKTAQQIYDILINMSEEK